MKCKKSTGDKKLDRQIIFWKIVFEAYTACVCTAILYLLVTGKCG